MDTIPFRQAEDVASCAVRLNGKNSFGPGPMTGRTMVFSRYTRTLVVFVGVAVVEARNKALFPGPGAPCSPKRT
jgi:hypothetical protein